MIQTQHVNTRHVINALPFVADALGRKHGVRVQIGGDHAFTDGRTIHIPALPLDADETAINLARAYIDHESGHLRFSDFGIFSDVSLAPLEKAVMNILEDYRIERNMSALYPGCRTNLVWLDQYLFKRYKAQQAGVSPLDILMWVITRLKCLDFPETAEQEQHFRHLLDRNFPGVRHELEPVMQRIPVECHDSLSCLEVAREIVRILQDYVNKQEEVPQASNRQQGASTHDQEDTESQEGSPSGEETDEDTRNGEDAGNGPEKSDSPQSESAGEEGEEGEEDGASGSGSPSDNDDEGTGQSESPTETQEDGEGQADAEGQKEASDPERSGGGQGADGAGKQVRELLDNPESLSALDKGKILEEDLKAIPQTASGGLSVAVPVEASASDLSSQEIADIRRATIALRTRLQALLQSTVSLRTRISRTGRIDTKRLARLELAEPRVFARMDRRQGINTAVHILLDSSGSMIGERIRLACHASYAVAAALEPIHGINLAVTTFPGQSTSQIETVSPLLRHREKLHRRFRLYNDGGTPLAEALWWVLQQMYFLPEQRKIILVVSDGKPNNIDNALNAIRVARSSGMELYGIGIMTDAMQYLLPKGECQNIFDIHELAPAMFEMLRKILPGKRPTQTVYGGRHELG